MFHSGHLIGRHEKAALENQERAKWIYILTPATQGVLKFFQRP